MVQTWSLKEGFDIRFGSLKSLARGRKMSKCRSRGQRLILSLHLMLCTNSRMAVIGALECVHAKKHVSIKHQDPTKWRDRPSVRTNCKFRIHIASNDDISSWLLSRTRETQPPNVPRCRPIQQICLEAGPQYD
jgi:hypothetical protein